uniref:C2H2-type domain-containing protein n=1 Tax=Rhodnius prolixus TaxID=13249 RepID=T1HQ14_RHOPR
MSNAVSSLPFTRNKRLILVNLYNDCNYSFRTVEEKNVECEYKGGIPYGEVVVASDHENAVYMSRKLVEEYQKKRSAISIGSDNSDVDSDDTGGSSGGEGEDISHISDFLKSSSTLLFPWTCNRCGEAFATRAPYEEHRRNCAKVDPANHPWKCHKCPNAYKNKKDLVRHLIYCGNDLPRLYCNRCGNSYKYVRGLRRHQKYCGTDVKPLKCSQCEKTYKYKRGLRRHQRRCGIAEALQFLAGKGVTPVVVTKRSFNVPGLGDLAKAGLPVIKATSQLAQLSQLSAFDKSFKLSANSENTGQTLENSSLGNSLLSEASVCGCGKVYKYKKSYDKHIATCVCGGPQREITSREEKPANSDRSDSNAAVLLDSDGDDGEEADDEGYDNKNEEDDQGVTDEEDSDEEDGDIPYSPQEISEGNEEIIAKDNNKSQEMKERKHVKNVYQNEEEDGYIDESNCIKVQLADEGKNNSENLLEEVQERIAKQKEGNKKNSDKVVSKEENVEEEPNEDDDDEVDQKILLNSEG